MPTNEEIIVEIMQEENCVGQENMITPNALIAKCLAKGIANSDEVGVAIVKLIDQDVIDYEMDADLKTSELWLL